MLSQSSPEIPNPPAPPIRVLIADDHLVMRCGLRAIIDAMDGWEVCGEAATGREAVELALHLQPEIVVMDMTLPELTGLEATRQIKKDSPNSEVLMFTVHDQEELIHDVFEAGARSYILKTDGMEHLQAALRSLAEHKPYFTTEIGDILLKNYLQKKSPAAAPELAHLTNRERQIVQLLAEGKSNKEVALALGISVKTAEAHRASCMKKLNLHAFSELVRYAIRNHLVSA